MKRIVAAALARQDVQKHIQFNMQSNKSMVFQELFRVSPHGAEDETGNPWRHPRPTIVVSIDVRGDPKAPSAAGALRLTWHPRPSFARTPGPGGL